MYFIRGTRGDNEDNEDNEENPSRLEVDSKSTSRTVRVGGVDYAGPIMAENPK